MWKESIARHVGWPSQIIDSFPIISTAATISAPSEAIDYRGFVSSVDTPDGAPEFRRKQRAGSKRYVFAGVGIAIVVVTFAVVLPKIADYRDVWAVVTTLTWEWAVVLAAATALNIATFAPPWSRCG